MELTIDLSDVTIHALQQLARDRSACEHTEILDTDLIRQAIFNMYSAELVQAEWERADNGGDVNAAEAVATTGAN